MVADEDYEDRQACYHHRPDNTSGIILIDRAQDREYEEHYKGSPSDRFDPPFRLGGR
jgi:hypothetical protein